MWISWYEVLLIWPMGLYFGKLISSYYVTRVNDSTQITIFGDSDLIRVTLKKMVIRLESRFSQNDSTRVTINDSRLESESFLQNLWASDRGLMSHLHIVIPAVVLILWPGSAPAGAGPNARFRRGAPLSSGFMASWCLVNRVAPFLRKCPTWTSRNTANYWRWPLCRWYHRSMGVGISRVPLATSMFMTNMLLW